MTSKRSARNTVTVTFTDANDYEALTKLAGEQDRTNAEQARHMLRAALRNSQYGPGVRMVCDAGTPDDSTQPPQEETKVLASREHQEPLPG